MAGALAGLTKTAAHEWPGVACKALDNSADSPVSEIVDELFREGPVEVGVTARNRHTLETVAAPIASSSRIPFGPSDVIVITGGARGVTAEAAVEMAGTGATIAMFGRSPPLRLSGMSSRIALMKCR